MADEEKGAARPQASEQTKGYAVVGAERASSVPEPASARLTWTDGERVIDYEARAAHLEGRGDDRALIGCDWDELGA